MFLFINRHRRAALALLTLSVAVLVSAIVWAVPGSNSGQWQLRTDFECGNNNLYCVVWEFSPGVTTGEPCCVTASDYAFNIPVCTSFEVFPVDP